MGLFDGVPVRTGGLFGAVPFAAPPTPMEAAPALPAMPEAVAVPSLADVLIGAMAPMPAAPLAPAPGMDALPAVEPLMRMPRPVPSVDPMLDAIRLSTPAATVGTSPPPVEPMVDTPEDQSTLAGDLRAAWLQAQQIIPGLQVAGGLADLKQAGDHVVSGGLADALGYAIDPQAQADLQEGLRGEGSHEIAAALPGIASLSDQINAIPMNPSAQKVGNAQTFGEGIDAAMDDPLGVLRSYGVRSLGTSIPTAVAAVAGTAAGGPLGAILAPGATSGSIETAMSVSSAMEGALRAAGVDVSSPEAVAGWVNANPEAFDGMLETALGRAGVIATADAATGGITGGLARAAARAGRPGTIAGHIAAGGAVEPLGEAAGEAGAQLATTGTIQPGDVLAEALGAAGMGAPTTAGQVAVEAMKGGPATAAPSARRGGLFADVPMAKAAAQNPEVSAPPMQAVAPTAAGPEQPAAAPVTPQQQEPHAPTQVQTPPAPSPEVAPQPSVPAPAEVGSAVPAGQPTAPGAVAQSAEPPAPQRKPFANLIRRAGIQVDPTGPAGQELAARGITSRTHPGLFRRGAHTDLDNIVAAEHPEIAALAGQDDATGYLAPAGIIDAIDREARGEFIAGADQQEIAANRRAWEEAQAEQTAAWAAPSVQEPGSRAWRIAHPDDDMALGNDRTGIVRATVDDAVRSLGVTVTPEEHSAIVSGLDRDGGDVEMAIEREIIRSVLNAESEEPAAIRSDIPGWEDGVPAEMAGAGAGTARSAGRDPAPEGGSEASAGEPRRAGPEALQTELTPEGEQTLVPGTEQRQTGEAQRQKAEMAARQQQSKMRRGDQARIEDDEGSLFGEPEGQLFERDGPSIRDVIAAARQQGHAAAKAAFAPVARWMSRATGRDLSGYQHVIDGSAVRHILKKHGDVRAEAARGQIAVTEADFERIPAVVADPDAIVLGTTNRLGRDQIGYVKRLDDGSFLYLEEIRTGKSELAAVSLRKYPATKDLNSVIAALSPNVRDDGGDARRIIRREDFFKADAGPAIEPGAERRTGRFGDRPEASSASARPRDENSTEDRGVQSRRPGGRLSPKFLDFSFTNRASVYGAAFRAAGVDPDEARNLPIERQLGLAAKALQERFGVLVQMPNYKVKRKNLVGRIVSAERPQISTREALDQLLDAFRQMQMLAHIMGVPEKAMALEIHGKPITLSLVSTKRFGSLGMFTWGVGGRKITLPGRSNSFAHEWGHALDHFLAEVSRNNEKALLSRRMDDDGVQALAPKAAMMQAFAGVMNALYGDRARLAALQLDLERAVSQEGEDGEPTPAARAAMKTLADLREGRRPPAAYLNRYFESSKQYDDMTASKGYFTDPAEMFARAFEAWVGRSAAAISDLPQGFLSKGAWGYDNDVDPRLALTFPKGADAEAFAVAMLEMQNAMTRSWLFGNGAPAAKPEDVDIYSDKALLMRLPRTSMAEAEKRATRQMVGTWRSAMSRLKGTVSAAAELPRGIWMEYLTSLTAAVHAVAARQKGMEAQAAITRIADMIGNDPGSGRYIEQPYQQAVEQTTRRNLRRLDGALGKLYQSGEMPEADRATLRALLTGQNPPAAAPLKRLASDIRTILDGVWYELKDAGIEVAYAPGYLPRIPNMEAVDADPAGFTRDAAKVYALMFQREVIDNPDAESQHQDTNTVIRKLRAARLPTFEGESEPASRLTTADEALIRDWRTAYTRLRQTRKALEKAQEATKPDAADVDRLTKRIASQEADVQRLQDAVLAMLLERFARYSAENWRARMRVGHMNDFDRMGPSTSFLAGRVLPAETDAMLADWLQNDPLELVTGYIHAAPRRAEYAKRFGAAGEKLENMLSAAERDGATSDEIALVRKAVNSATGRFRHPSKAGERVLSMVYATATLAMLGRATFSSLAEPVTAGLRSGFVRDSLLAIVQQVRTLVSRGRREDLFELARVIGAVTSSIHETVMANRLGADSAGLSKGMSTALAAFFRKSLLTPLTNFQRVANLPVAHGIIMRHLRRADRFADGELNELGIATEDRADLLQWLDGLQGIPTPEDLLAPDGSFYNRAAELWANAVVRLTDQTIQNPAKSDRPIMANHPAAAALYGIMSFTMSFQRNILVRTLRRGTADRETKIGKAAQVGANMAWAAPAVAMLFAAQLLSTIIREAIFNAQTWREKDDDDELLDWLMNRAFWRTGIAGMSDPFMQILLGVKYERDLTAAAAGPHAGYFLQNLQTILEAFVGRNSANTNTTEHNAVRAAYQAFIQPTVMGMLAAAGPGGPLTGLLSTGGIWWLSSPQASTAFADALVGPKGRDYKKEGIEAPWWELGGLIAAG